MRRSKFYLSLLMILLFCCLLYGQTAQEILAKNVEARGGIKQLSAVKIIKYTGTFKQPGIDADLTMYFKSPDKLLLDVAIGKIKAKIGCDDRTLWKQNPGGTPKEMPRRSDRLTVAFAENHASLFAFKEKGYEFELVGKEDFEGAEVYKIKVVPEKGDTIYLLIDGINYITLGFYIELGEGAIDAFYFRDYKETDGILLPYYMEARKSIGEITKCAFEKIETNVDVDETIFNLPGSQPIKNEQEKEQGRIPIEYTYGVPEKVDDGWETASLKEVGMKTEPIIDLMDNLLNRSDHSIHSVLIIKNGKLVFEEYFKGRDLIVNEESLRSLVIPGSKYSYTNEVQFDRNTLHFQASVTKSITSILFGIALDKNLIGSVNDKMFSFFPEYGDLAVGERGNIAIKHMLSMASGIPWSEAYPFYDSRNYLYQLLAAKDPLRYVLEQKLVAPPGKVFNYNSGTTILLGEIIRRASKMDLVEFAKDNLFSPLGIEDFQMISLPNTEETFFASSGLFLRPRDMAKIGQLYLDEGLWNNKQIVSADWVQDSVREAIRLPSSNPLRYFANGYGYQWWLGTFSSKNVKAYAAAGFGDQFIFVMPEIKMVVVLTGGNWDGSSPFFVYDYVINKYVLEAL